MFCCFFFDGFYNIVICWGEWKKVFKNGGSNCFKIKEIFKKDNLLFCYLIDVVYILY